MDGRTWLGWPVWLVTLIMVFAALTASAGPVGVLLLLGSFSAMALYGYVTIASWSQRRDQDRAEPPAEEPHIRGPYSSEVTPTAGRLQDRAPEAAEPAVDAGPEPRRTDEPSEP